MRLAFTGDVMLGRLVNQYLKKAPPEYPWGSTLGVLSGADARIINLECVISDKGEPWSTTPKAFHFRADAKNVKTLQAADVTALSNANNHALDFGHDAMLDMLDILDRAGIGHAGAGSDLEAASGPALFNAGRRRIGLIAFTDNEPGWEAGRERPGVFHVPVDTTDSRALRLFRIIGEARRKVDMLIVSVHWGPNWGYRPVPRHIPFAHALVDSGADVVFGHSCHVFQGIEIYRRRPILYGTGDFIDDYAVHPVERNDESFVFMVHAGLGGIEKLRLYPTVISRFQANMAGAGRAEDIAGKMQKLCAGFRTRARWNARCGCLEVG